MVQFNVNFEVPKHNLKKLNKVFDLDTLGTDEYEVMILSNIAGLNKDNLDKVDSNILSKEANNYERPLIQLSLTNLASGYQIEGNVFTVYIDNNVSIPVVGMLIVKKDTNDILACCLTMNQISLIDEFSLSPQAPLWVIGDMVCTA